MEFFLFVFDFDSVIIICLSDVFFGLNLTGDLWASRT